MAILLFKLSLFNIQLGDKWTLLFTCFFFVSSFAVMLETKHENVLLLATVSVVLAAGVFILWGPTFRQKRKGKLDTACV